MRQGRMGTLAATLAMGAALTACSSSAGLGNRNAPDEFAIVTKAPLVVPPDYALRPPRPGETRPQEMSSADRARQLMMGDATAAPPSRGELALIQDAGALETDQNIRAILAAENGGQASKDASLANRILFWQVDGDAIDDSAAPLQVEDEAAWMEQRRKSIENVTGGATVTIAKDDEGVLRLPGVR